MDTTNIEAASIEGSATGRKPRLALMGEFSAGKSTLSNMLLGCAPLPVRVTATRLPPVWISFGEENAFRVDMDGTEHPLDIEDIPNIQFEKTKMIKLFLKSDALELCDLIDMPGISDPNMSSSVWETMFSEIDSVVWCTHATQAWRQSEAAAWDLVRSKTNGNNLIIISQFDKLRTERDQSRVLERVRKETAGLFKGVFPVSLTGALNAQDDADKWERSGAARFTEELVELLLCTPETEYTPKPLATQTAPVLEDPLARHPAAQAGSTDATAVDAIATGAAAPAEAAQDNQSEPAVVPRRIRASSGGRSRERLPTSAAGSGDAKQAILEAAKGD